MRSRAETVFQIKVTLQGVRPPVWRRLQVPATYSFWDLHVAIQDAMGWLDYHLHQFRVVPAPRHRSLLIGIPDDDAFEGDPPVLPGWEIPIRKYLSLKRNTASYEYDFGDGWRHRIVLEQVVPRQPGVRYPICVAGARRCPPEDVGGVQGYEEFLRAIADPEHEEHDSYLTWVGGAFDPQAIRFWDPEERWRIAFLDEDEDEESSAADAAGDEHAIELANTLRAEVARASTLFRTWIEPAVSRDRSPGKWVRKQILGHLIDSAANNHVAAVIASTSAEKLQTPCVIADREPQTLGWWMQDYLRHLKHHVEQIERG
jgi:hypothetical protein